MVCTPTYQTTSLSIFLFLPQEFRVFIRRHLIKSVGIRTKSVKQRVFVTVSRRAFLTDHERMIYMEAGNVSELYQWIVRKTNIRGDNLFSSCT